MPITIERDEFDDEVGFQYHVDFAHPHSFHEIRNHVRVDAALTVSETGDLADVSFVVPKPCRNDHALSLMVRQPSASYIAPHYSLSVPGQNGDAIANATAHLEVDTLGRVVGMIIQWNPTESN